MAQSVRISQRGDQIAEEIHQLTGMSKTAIVEAALEAYRHQERMRLLNESYAKYRSNEKAWKEELKEREELEGTMSDGFENE